MLLSSFRFGSKLSGRRRTALLAAGVLAVPLLLVATPLQSASANIAGSTFEGGDGNLVVNTAGNTDWNTPPPHFVVGRDTPSGSGDTSFQGSVKENTVNPGVTTGSIPNSKDDLNRFYAAWEKLGTGAAAQVLLDLAWIRNKTSGSADMDFELNQSTATTSDGLPVRTPGDLMITYEFIATKTPEINVLRWRLSSDRCWNDPSEGPGTNCWAERIVLNSSNSEGAVNDGRTVTDGSPAGLGAKLLSQTFGEAAINLTSVGIFTQSTCTNFARVFAKTRSSHSFGSSMQDYIGAVPINISNCLTKSFDITATGGVPTGTTLYGVFTTADGVTHSVALAPGSTAGHLTGSDSSVVPGTTITNVHLELRDAAGTVLWSNTAQSEVISADKTNTGAFSYALTLTPVSAENFAGRAHVLTATLTGTGSLNGIAQTTAPIPGVTVGFRLENGTPSGCGTLSPTSAITNSAGVATTTLTSTNACSTTIRAFVDKAGSTTGYDSTDTSATATKTFVVYGLSVTPASATNELGKPHTFTITLTKDTGGGAAGYANQSVDFSIADPNNTGAYVQSVNGTATGSTTVTSGTCTTTSAGKCTIVTLAPRTGTFTLNASYTTANASGQGTFTGSGTKSFVDYRIGVTPASATNQVNVPHTFTVLLEKSTNNTWAPVSGASVGLTLTKTAGDAAVTSVNGGPAATSCTTRADGTCSVVINATQPGLVTLTASYSKLLDSGTLTRSASGTKQYSDFTLDVTPQTATNDLQHPQHTFTVTLQRNDGSGFVGYNGQTVTLGLDPGTSGATITSINGVPGSGTSCTTQGQGTCSVVVTATQAGTAVLTASWSQVLSANSTASRTASGSKQYSDFRLDVAPKLATNDLQHLQHTFTVTLQRNDGSGFFGYSGQTVTLNLDPGTSGATITSINGVPGGGTSCVTQSDGTCSVVVTATQAGKAILTASFSKVLSSSDTVSRTDSGSKQYSDFALTVTPLNAINALGQPHTFTVTLTRNDGSGFAPYGGQPISLSLNPGASTAHFTDINGNPATGTTGSCTTLASGPAIGTCAVTINSSTAGTAVLTATWSQALSSTDTASLTASGTKRYLSLSAIKTACAGTVPPNGLVAFDIPWSTAGTTLTNAKITDTLPIGLTFVPTGSTPGGVVSGQTITYTLQNPLPDPSSGTVHIVTVVGSAVPLGSTLTNTGAFTADGGVSKTFSASIIVNNNGAAASGRAYGLTATLGGTALVTPTPDTDKKNPDSLLTLGIPPLAPTVLSGGVGLLNVRNTPALTATGARDEAVSTVADVSLTVAGVPITAKAVQARSDSTATGSTAASSISGSQVVGLQVGAGAPVQDISSPTVKTVVNLAGVTVTVSVLEQLDASGAALGGAAGTQPQLGLFNSGLAVNGLHIRAVDPTGTVLADVIVSHAGSKAAFPTLTPCAVTGPYVVGSAFVAAETLAYPTGPTAATVVPVTLGSAGGSMSGAANAADLSVIGATSGTGTADTAGTLSPLTVDSDAKVQRLVLTSGTTTVISATLVQAHSSVNSLTSSGATVAKLVINGTDVCAALGLTATCSPPPNTKLLDVSKTLTIVLNEQKSGSGVLTVNAVHIYVLGTGNPLGLPVGSDLIISSATAGSGG